MADKLPTPEDLLDAAAALPLAPLTPVQQLSALGRLARVAAGSPLKLARAGAEFSSELAQVVVGKSSVAPEPGDRRFSHQAWTDNPLYKRLGQSYLSW
ncbi:MAG: poly(3-hydroxyalkanoate) polymerase, partial [Acidimicrobiia bacterium]|nr:poly(3-hydroxyalkanoate) polymerase [Acidimicrobiia bacterium]